MTYQQSQLKELFRYCVMDLWTSKEYYVDRKPRRDSKWWDDTKYIIWDNKHNEKALKNN